MFGGLGCPRDGRCWPAADWRPRIWPGLRWAAWRIGANAAANAASQIKSPCVKFRAQFVPEYRADLDLIFANPDGTPLKPDSISASVSALFKRLKIRKPRGAALHLRRHNACIPEGVPLPVFSERLGHSSIRTTAEIYAHAIQRPG
jgi:site-specific recombinase XerD